MNGSVSTVCLSCLYLPQRCTCTCKSAPAESPQPETPGGLTYAEIARQLDVALDAVVRTSGWDEQIGRFAADLVMKGHA